MLTVVLLAFAPSAPGSPAPRSANLVLCPDEDRCAEALAWLDGLPALDDAPLQLAEAVLELDTGGWQDGEPLAEVFSDALTRARLALDKRHWQTADGALLDADRALERWAGTADAQALVDLWILRGVVRLHQDRQRSAEAAFQRAATLAWNRSVVLPMEDETIQQAWLEAQRAVLAQPTGRLRLSGSTTGCLLHLNGVPLGQPPLELVVFPGQHRLTATDPDRGLEWKRDLTVHPGQTTTAVAGFQHSGDARWVVQRLEEAMTGLAPPAEVLDVLSDWAGRHGLLQVRLLAAQPSQGTRTEDPVYELQELVYDPLLRRLSAPEP
jgi:hypothetical protein